MRAARSEDESRPNILFIVTDQQSGRGARVAHSRIVLVK